MKITGAVLEEIGRSRPFAESKPISIAELELSAPGPTEILVRLEAAGICHSDLSVVDGNRVRPVPMLLGHEAAGRVVEVGAAVTDLQPGQRVVMSFLPRCEECANCAADGRLPCTAGSKSNNEGTLLHGSQHLSRGGEPVFHHLGVSGFASHAVVDRASAVPVGDDIPADIAAVLGCAVLTGGGAVLNAAKPQPADSIMIVGLGGVGMAALITAVSQGISRIVAVDTLDEKLEHARRLGAHETYTPQQLADEGVKAKFVVECAGSARAFETAAAKLAMLDNISKYGWRADYVKEREQIVKAMTLPQIQSLSQKYLDPSKMVWLVVGDGKTQLPRMKALGFDEPVVIGK